MGLASDTEGLASSVSSPAPPGVGTAGSGNLHGPESLVGFKRRRPLHLRLWGTIAAFAVVAAFIGLVIVPGLLVHDSPSCAPADPPGWTDTDSAQVVGCHTTFTLAGDSYTYYGAVRYSDGEIMVGDYSSAVAIGAYLLNSTELGQVEQSPTVTAPPPSSVWSCGQVTVCNVQADVPPSPGSYFLVLENLHSSKASVEWTTSLLILYRPNSGYG